MKYAATLTVRDYATFLAIFVPAIVVGVVLFVVAGKEWSVYGGAAVFVLTLFIVVPIVHVYIEDRKRR